MNHLHFDGPEFNPHFDGARLTNQHERIKAYMLNGYWRTLREIAIATDSPESSVSAQLRHMRKPEYGSYVIDKRRRGDPKCGLYEYRVNQEAPDNNERIV